MRICRYYHKNQAVPGFYNEDIIVPVAEAAAQCPDVHPDAGALNAVSNLLELMPHGRCHDAARAVYEWGVANRPQCETFALPTDKTRLLRPIETPGKMLLLAGNYAAHVRESGDVAAERAETFPYVFMKPENTFNDPNAPIPIPEVSSDHIDYECELGVVIGRVCKDVTESEALACVAGYTVVNDISDRRYKPVPERKTRPKDVFFDWLHGKWHDGFCPMGPCMISSHAIPDPQILTLTQHINGEMRQNASTAQMVFPVAAVIAFISRSVTLKPGDIISTGTPEGIGMPTGNYLHAGDTLDAAVSGIGVLHNIMT